MLETLLEPGGKRDASETADSLKVGSDENNKEETSKYNSRSRK